MCADGGLIWAANGAALNCCGNDANEANPYVSPEDIQAVCSDGNDNDCNGLIDTAEVYCDPLNINQDDTIDIFDLALVAMDFHSSPGDHSGGANTDVNFDGTVNIKDLVLISANFS